MPSDNSLICMRLNMAAGAVNCFFLEGLKSSAEISDTDVCDSAYSLKSLIQIFFFRFRICFTILLYKSLELTCTVLLSRDN